MSTQTAPEAASLASASTQDLYRELLIRIGEDPNREGLIKNPNRVARAYSELVCGLYSDPRVHLKTIFHERYDEIVLVAASGAGPSLSRERLTRGVRQLVVVGATLDEVPAVAAKRVTIVSLGLQPMADEPLRLTASIVLAEIARQVGRRRPLPGPPPRVPRYEKAIEPAAGREVLLVDPVELLAF